MTEHHLGRYSYTLTLLMNNLSCSLKMTYLLRLHGIFLISGMAVLCMLGTHAHAQDNSFDFLPVLPNEESALSTGEDFQFERTPEELEEEMRREAFDNALEGLLPLRPEEIREVLKRYGATQDAVNTPIHKTPKPVFTVETLSTDPGSAPTTIKVAQGYVTTVNIVDTTGAPGPIEDITWAGDFEIVEQGGETSGHFIRIAPQSEFAYGNMSVHMLGLQTPIIITMETSRDVVHYRFDAIIPEAGPFAKIPLIETGIKTTAGNVSMTSLLEGVLPPDAARLRVSGTDTRTSAYKYDGMTYLRTPLSLLSPAWTSSATSADGMRIYALTDTPVLLLSDNGRMVRARLSEYEDTPNDH